jgi:transcriptional regulator with XRE-family HTH domain
MELDEQIQSQLNSFGARLRELRLKRGWTLEELAARCALSKAFLSRLESGGRQASIAAVLTLSRIFEVSLAALFESQIASEPCVIVRGASAVETSINGLSYTSLSKPDRLFNLQPIKVTIPISRSGSDHYRHAGEEWIYVLSGKLTLSLAGNRYDLKPGDAAHFDSQLPHRLIARGKRDAQVLLVASQISEPGRSAPSIRQFRAIPLPDFLTFKPTSEPVPKPRNTEPTPQFSKKLKTSRRSSP